MAIDKKSTRGGLIGKISVFGTGVLLSAMSLAPRHGFADTPAEGVAEYVSELTLC